jgi:hypothetical protein
LKVLFLLIHSIFLINPEEIVVAHSTILEAKKLFFVALKIQKKSIQIFE